jgi:hypothetical protein
MKHGKQAKFIVAMLIWEMNVKMSEENVFSFLNCKFNWV